jgi:hypothetical protein
MQVVTGYQNRYPVPGVRAGLPCLGLHKYGGLALQVGGWATGRQPFTVKKLIFRKTKLWPRNRLSGIDLGSGKGYEMRYEVSNLEYGSVYKQIFKNAKLPIGKRGQK